MNENTRIEQAILSLLDNEPGLSTNAICKRIGAHNDPGTYTVRNALRHLEADQLIYDAGGEARAWRLAR